MNDGIFEMNILIEVMENKSIIPEKKVSILKGLLNEHNFRMGVINSVLENKNISSYKKITILKVLLNEYYYNSKSEWVK